MRKYFTILALPIVAVAANALLSPLYGLLGRPGGDIVFNIVRISLWIYAGWRLAFIGGFSTWSSALSGAVLFFIDHPIIKGGHFLIHHEVLAFEGVIVSYCMFCFVPVGFAAIGAAVGKRRKAANSTDTTSDAV